MEAENAENERVNGGMKEIQRSPIANPPYVFARESKEKGLTSKDKEYFYKHFMLAEYQVNLYPLFVELSMNTLKRNGVLCYITPNNWMTINTNTKLRKLILDQSSITIVNFYAKVFESASVDSSIIIFQKSEINSSIKLYEYEDRFSLISEKSTAHFKGEHKMVINIESLKNKAALSLVEMIEDKSQFLSEYALVKAGLQAYEIGKGNPPQTKEMKKERVYHSRKKTDEDYIKYLNGRDVCRYYSTWGGEYLKYGDNLASPRNIGLFDTPRILVRQIPSKPPYCINACYLNELSLNDRNSMNIVRITGNPYFLLSILNSRVISYWFIHKFGKLQRGIFPQFKVNELKIFPIPIAPDSQKAEIAEYAEKIVKFIAADPEGNVKKPEYHSLNQKIDQLIYQLYDLTSEEIQIIEEAVA